MPKKKNRIIIDTNLWISFLLTDDFSNLDKVFKDTSVILLFSQTLLDEFVEVAQRPKFKTYFSSPDLERLLLQIKEQAEFIDSHIHWFLVMCNQSLLTANPRYKF